jgi:hypothetical protein
MKQFQDLNSAFRSDARRISSTNWKLASVRPYRVGELLVRGHHCWPEGAQLALGPGRFELTIFRRDDCANLMADVQRGEAEFALIVDLPVIVLAYRLGELGAWNDVPFSWHLQATKAKIVPRLDHAAEARALLWISLVGAEDGIIQAQRGMTLSPAFTFALREAIRAQAMTTFDSEECTLAISRLYLKHPSIAERLSLAAARTMGNE